MVLAGLEFCLTGGDLTDSQLLANSLGLAALGGVLGKYDASGPVSRLGSDLGGIERNDVRVSGGRMLAQFY